MTTNPSRSSQPPERAAHSKGSIAGLSAAELRLQSIPLHEMVKQKLTDAILSGELAAGTVLPAELELAQSYGIAVGTLRRALLSLTEEGLLTRRRKTGTVVTGRSPQLTLQFLIKYFRLHDLEGRLQLGESLSISVTTSPATPDEAAVLLLAEGTPLCRFRRLRLVDGMPVMIDSYGIEAARLRPADTLPEKVPHQLYLYLEHEHGMRLTSAREALSAELNADAAVELGLEPGTPLLRIDEVAYDQTGQPVIMAVHHADTSRHRYINEIR